MTTGAITPYRSGVRAGHDGFGQLLRAEWTKFRTVRGWLAGVAVAALMIVAMGLLIATGGQASCGNRACPAPPLGPGGQAVRDSFYCVRQPLAGNDSITVRVTALTGLYSSGSIQAGQGLSGMRPGLDPWAKAGIIIKATTRQGSAYAAMMVTGGHGVRMQYDYTQDTAGLSAAVSAASPRWLRLTRSGDTVTGYESADGARWIPVGTATLAGLPSTVQAGLFAASPAHSRVTAQGIGSASAIGGPALATAAFDHVSLRGTRRSGTGRSGTWTGDAVGGGGGGLPASAEEFHQAGGRFTVTGAGDIAPDVPAVPADDGTPIEFTLVGVFAGLIAVIVVAAMFITTEYRRGLIRTTLAASPRRGRVLAAKATVIAAVTFAAGLAGTAIAVLLGAYMLRSSGYYVFPVGVLTELRVVAGTAALLAVAAVFALALGTIMRRSAGPVTAVIALIVVPYFFTGPLSVLHGAAVDWLLRVTPAAAFA